MTNLAKQIDRFTETDIDDEIVVMRLDTGEFFSLAGTGAAAWRLIDGTRDRAGLINALAAEFDGEEAEIAADVDEFLLQLKEFGLVVA
jgi:hypothetical protein